MDEKEARPVMGTIFLVLVVFLETTQNISMQLALHCNTSIFYSYVYPVYTCKERGKVIDWS